MSVWLWLDGEVVPGEEARLSPLDHGLTVGDGVFETLRVIDGTPFALTRHLARLRRSAAAMDLDPGLDDDQFREACAATLKAAAVAGDEPGRVRFTVTGGLGPLGSDRSGAASTVLVAAAPASPWAPTTGVVTVPWVRNERGALAGVKSTSYAENVKALSTAHRAGASEAVFANTVGSLCEGTGTNVFVVAEGRLMTPTLASGCLAGITRELVCELVEVIETDALRLGDLKRADEAFLTSSTRDVHPIASVDGTLLPTLCPGPLTQLAAAALTALQARDLDP